MIVATTTTCAWHQTVSDLRSVVQGAGSYQHVQLRKKIRKPPGPETHSKAQAEAQQASASSLTLMPQHADIDAAVNRMTEPDQNQVDAVYLCFQLCA